MIDYELLWACQNCISHHWRMYRWTSAHMPYLRDNLIIVDQAIIRWIWLLVINEAYWNFKAVAQFRLFSIIDIFRHYCQLKSLSGEESYRDILFIICWLTVAAHLYHGLLIKKLLMCSRKASICEGHCKILGSAKNREGEHSCRKFQRYFIYWRLALIAT